MNENQPPGDHFERAKELATTLALAHVGNVTEMAHAETVEVIEEHIGDDIDLLSGVVRILSLSTALLAGQLAEAWAPSAGDSERHDVTMRILREGIGGLEGHARRIDRD